MNPSQNSPLSGGMQYQLQIYFEGLQNKKPDIPVQSEELERKASEILSPEASGYVAGSAGSESTAANNLDALRQWQILPRMMGDVSQRSIATDILGKSYPSLVLLAPVGVLSIVHPEGELAVARAAAALRVPQIVSTVSSFTLEEIAAANGDNPKWFQLYWGRNKEFTKSLLGRAEKAGYEAIVVTLDTRLFAWRERDIQQAYLPFLQKQGLANYLSDPVFLEAVGDPSKNLLHTMMQFASCFSNPASVWENLSEIRDSTSLPILVKGVLHPHDAWKALDVGVDGIIVSNHGGRQLDGAVGAFSMLGQIADAVGTRTTLLFDSGIRRGADVFKAMAMGAKGVLLGRPYVYGLALTGEKGVRDVTANLLADTDLTLGLAGCTSWKEVTREFLVKK